MQGDIEQCRYSLTTLFYILGFEVLGSLNTTYLLWCSLRFSTNIGSIYFLNRTCLDSEMSLAITILKYLAKESTSLCCIGNITADIYKLSCFKSITCFLIHKCGGILKFLFLIKRKWKSKTCAVPEAKKQTPWPVRADPAYLGQMWKMLLLQSSCCTAYYDGFVQLPLLDLRSLWYCCIIITIFLEETMAPNKWTCLWLKHH